MDVNCAGRWDKDAVEFDGGFGIRRSRQSSAGARVVGGVWSGATG